MSSYPDIFRSIFQTAIEVWPSRRITLTFLKDFVLDLKQYGRISINDVVIVSFIAVSLTLLRSSLTSVIFTVRISSKLSNTINHSKKLGISECYL